MTSDLLLLMTSLAFLSLGDAASRVIRVKLPDFDAPYRPPVARNSDQQRHQAIGNSTDQPPVGHVEPRDDDVIDDVIDDVGGNGKLAKAADIAAITASCIVALIVILAAVTCWYRRVMTSADTSKAMFNRATDTSVLISGASSGGGGGPLNQHLPTFPDFDRSYGTSEVGGMANSDKYPSYGITGPNPMLNPINFDKSIDGHLTKEAELFHYKQTKKRIQQQQQQQTTMNYNNNNIMSDDYLSNNGVLTGAERCHQNNDHVMGDEETSDGEFTVYECSGFASMTDEPMEIRNPFFDFPPRDSSSMTSSPLTSSSLASSTSPPSGETSTSSNSNHGSLSPPSGEGGKCDLHQQRVLGNPQAFGRKIAYK